MRAIGSFAYHRAPGVRVNVEANLRVVLDSTPATANEVNSLVRRSFKSYGAYWSDVFHLAHMSKRRVLRSFIDHDLAPVRSILDAGGTILALPHLGTWEMGGLWLHHQGFSVLSVAEPASSPQLTAWFTRERARLGLVVHQLGERTTAALLEGLSRGEIIALVADRDIVGDGIEVTMFGRSTSLPGGPALLALRSGRPLVPCAIYQQPHGRYLPVALESVATDRRGSLREDIARITQDLATAFEVLIAGAPDQWHVFQPRFHEVSPSMEVG